MSDFSNKDNKQSKQDYFDEYGNYKFPNQYESDVPNTTNNPSIWTKEQIDDFCEDVKNRLTNSLIYGFVNWEYELPKYIKRAKKLKSGSNIVEYFQTLYEIVLETKKRHPNTTYIEKYFTELNPNFYWILSESIHCLDLYEEIDKKEVK